MNKLILTCFLALLCLVGRYLAASEKVADSPQEELHHRAALQPVSPHSGDTHREGETLPDTFPRIDFGLVDPDQDMGAGEEASSLQPAPFPVFSSPLYQSNNSTNQLSLELSGDEGSKLAPDSRGQWTVDRGPLNLPSSPARRGGVSGLPSSSIGHPPIQLSLELSGNEGSKLAPHNGGQWTVEGGPKYETASSLLGAPRSEDTSLDTSVLILDTSSPVLIYGELINPDSLGPLTVTFTPYYLNKKIAFEEQVLDVPLQEGTMFDGVVNPYSSKFLIQSPSLKRPAYFTLKLDNRVVLGDYLVFPGDSLKVYVDLKNSHIVFSGPDALTAEVQYGMKRMKIRSEFSEPRKIVMANPNQAFSEADLLQWELQKQAFGARLEMENPNAQTLDMLLEKISTNNRVTLLKENGLDQVINKLDPLRKDLILLDFYSDYYRSPLSMLYLYYYPAIPKILESDKLDSTYARIKQLLEGFPTTTFLESSKLVSAEWLEMELNRLSLLSLICNEPFQTILQQNHKGEVAERLGTAFLDRNLRRYPNPAALLTEYEGFIQTDPWVKKVKSLKSATVAGEQIISNLIVQDISGNTVGLESVLQKPTLVYFYFSTCSHSAKYFNNLLYPFYLDKAKAMGVDLIAISVDKNPSLWQSAIGEYSDSSIPNYLFLPDSKENWESHYNISGYPRTFILDPKGKILSFGLSRESEKAFEDDFHKIFPTDNSTLTIDKP